MSILFLLIPLALVLIALALWAFVWAVNHDQFEDLDRASRSILFDDDLPPRDSTAQPEPQSQSQSEPQSEPEPGERVEPRETSG